MPCTPLYRPCKHPMQQGHASSCKPPTLAMPTRAQKRRQTKCTSMLSLSCYTHTSMHAMHSSLHTDHARIRMALASHQHFLGKDAIQLQAACMLYAYVDPSLRASSSSSFLPLVFLGFLFTAFMRANAISACLLKACRAGRHSCRQHQL